ncbi:hypothetical protein BJV78DRAFT_290531 [Lactifluus subvellereus]|nr:hypothetical protein BJV78DRAFT_290531 [Lactifluus subvellereus]
MAVCIPSPTLTLFSTVISTTVITTFSTVVQTQPATTSTFVITSCLSDVAADCASSTVITRTSVIPGGFTTVSVPVIVTNIITEVNPTVTLFASCSFSSIPSNTRTPGQSPSQSMTTPSSTPTTLSVTTTPSPVVVTQQQSSTLYNGAVTVVTVISTSSPPPSVVLVPTAVAASQASSSTSASTSSSDAAPIAGGAVGGFFILVGVVAAVWFILRKCRKSGGDLEEEDIVFPYPVTRDRDQTRRLDLTREPKPYVYGLVGSTMAEEVVTPRNSPPPTSHSRTANDGRPGSANALIGAAHSGRMTTVTSASGSVASSYSAQSRRGEVGRQASHISANQLPPGAAPPLDHFSLSGGRSGSGTAPGSSWLPLQTLNSPLPSAPIRSSPGVVPSSNTTKALLAASERDIQLRRPEKKPTRDPSSGGDGPIHHTDWGRLQAPDRGPGGSGSGSKHSVPPQVTTPDVIDAPPAYVA